MQLVYVVHYHEIALKGRNRPDFLRALQENICATTGLGKGEVRIVSGRLIVKPPLNLPLGKGEKIGEALSRVFGISSFSPAVLVSAEYGEIEEAVRGIVIYGGRTSDSTEVRPRRFDTFAIAATRGDKQFPMTSKEIEIRIGDFVRKEFGKKVDLENPDVTFYVEVFSASKGQSFVDEGLSFGGGALVYIQKIPGPGGLPVGIAAKAAVLLSGGIDSPVAAYRIMKRGAPIIAVHFHSYPFASRASIDKVKEVVKILEQYHGGRSIALYSVPLAEAQKVIVKECNERYRVLLYRRMMWRIAAEIAARAKAQALVTGESLGQVASQTIENMAAVEHPLRMPIFRPLIGYDKEEIIAEAKRIGTYDTSIQPHDDCCTLFMPKRVATKARIDDLDIEEAKLAVEDLTQGALSAMEVTTS